MQPPIMGWSSWNCFRQNINEETIYDIAKSMKQLNLDVFGYKYINLDDCWQSSLRDKCGDLQFDLSNFPNGKNMIRKIHDLDLKVGLYSSCGRLTCEDLPASFNNERRDAKMIIDSGADLLKYDYCHVVDLESDEKWINQAPLLIEVEFFNIKTKRKYSYYAKDGILEGSSEIKQSSTDESIFYVSGLTNNQGNIKYDNLNMPKGEYIITVVYRKQKTNERMLLELKFNDYDSQVIYFPTSSGWSETGREQVEIKFDYSIERMELGNPVHNQQSDAQLRYKIMKKSLDLAIASSDTPDKPFIYTICEHGRNKPWIWAKELSHSYRISPDIENNWQSVLNCYEKAMEVSKYAIEGSYADPDMLEVGNGKLTNTENISHFTLWCFLSAPLVLGNDLRKFTNNKLTDNSLEVITNSDVIQINQSRPFLPAQRLVEGETDILVKYAIDGIAWICFFNKTSDTQKIPYDLSKLPQEISGYKFEYNNQDINELWGNNNYTVNESIISVVLQPHEVLAFRLYL